MSSPKATNLEEEKIENTRRNGDGNAVWRGAPPNLSSAKPLRTLLGTAEIGWAKTDLSHSKANSEQIFAFWEHDACAAAWTILKLHEAHAGVEHAQRWLSGTPLA
jgi:hypothetical protein